jgi:hypothetical protein
LVKNNFISEVSSQIIGSEISYLDWVHTCWTLELLFMIFFNGMRDKQIWERKTKE